MKDIDWFEIIIRLMFLVLAIGIVTFPIVEIILDSKSNDYIKQLEQNQIQQVEEKEVYVNKCKMYEDLMKENGLTLDECECN